MLLHPQVLHETYRLAVIEPRVFGGCRHLYDPITTRRHALFALARLSIKLASKDVLEVSAYHYKLDSVSDDDFKKWFHEELTPNLEDLKKLLSDPDYQEKGRDSEKGWIDSSRGEIRVGWETTYSENGEVVNTRE
ncbi:hypothetical protein JX266_005093 [Neoarthrinium moseri]|nr:hypothetical protein JX266_005093 [Neoarthrinium moseri]